MTTAKLLLHCPDKPGILAEVTDFITVNKGNIIYLDQYVDHVENIFFMRIEWELKDFLVPQEKIEDYFRTLYGQKYEMDFRLYFSDVKPRMAIFVSKLSHCLFDILARYTAGEWNVDIPLIISNHPDLQHVAERFGNYLHIARQYNKCNIMLGKQFHLLTLLFFFRLLCDRKQIERNSEPLCYMLQIRMVTYNKRYFYIPFSGCISCQYIEKTM